MDESIHPTKIDDETKKRILDKLQENAEAFILLGKFLKARRNCPSPTKDEKKTS